MSVPTHSWLCDAVGNVPQFNTWEYHSFKFPLISGLYHSNPLDLCWAQHSFNTATCLLALTSSFHRILAHESILSIYLGLKTCCLQSHKMGSKQIASFALLRALFWHLLLISSSNCKFLKIGPNFHMKLQLSSSQHSRASKGRKFLPKQGKTPRQSSHIGFTSFSRALAREV